MTDPAAHYTVLARRFRPQTFEDVVGQDRIGQALRNAIQAGRVAHAYLFTGARGVGKTSTARIFAKALNCPNVQNAVPCNDCEVCDSISAGSDVDVLEIDGASNRGIDDIRSLRANVNIRSMRSPYKVYIIDEVHMLTKEAFNALLKTLEEPPPNVKFIFCTTEPNKVPDTILSRCQRFDFGTIAASSIQGRLAQIAQAEGVEVDEAALELLSRRAAGSMRDSQSLFDQLLAFGSDRITTGDVHQLLGTAGDDRLMGLFDAIIARRRDEALLTLDTAMNEGVQIGAFSDQLLHYLRDLLIIAAGADAVALESVSESQREKLAQQAKAWGLQTITAALEILAATKSRMQRVNYDRALLELAVMRLSLLEELDNIGAVISRIGSGSGTGGANAAPGRPSSPSARTPDPVASRGQGGGVRNQAAEIGTPQGSQGAPVEAGPIPVVPPEPTPQPTESVAEIGTNGVSEDVSSVKSVEFSESSVKAFWSEVLAGLPDRLSGHLEKQCGLAISGPNKLEISFPQSYVLGRQFCERPETLRRIADVATKVAGNPIEISVITSQNGTDAPPPRRTESQPQIASRKKKASVESDPFVQQALDIFGGTLIDARDIHETASEK